MPQLGETVTEGTITRWFKQVGESVAADEPLFEVSTDKVDSEVPAPTSGVVTEILVPEGDTVDVGVRLAVISDSAAAPRPRPPRLRRPSRRPRRRPQPRRPRRHRRPLRRRRSPPHRWLRLRLCSLRPWHPRPHRPVRKARTAAVAPSRRRSSAG